MSTEELAEQVKVMGDPTRLRILSLLPVTDNCDDVFNVTELAEELGIPQPTVSHHLKMLKHAGLVKCRKMCRDVYYWIDQETFARVTARLGALLERCFVFDF
jgi:ArsR family transcriptional regulator